jgi:hypothetical protein
MQNSHLLRLTGLFLAAVMTVAASTGATAQFIASQPGADLEPIGNAESIVSLLQANQKIMWKSLAGPVTSVTVRGWPVSEGEVELGGGLTISRPEDGRAGVIDFGDNPMSATFELSE